MRVVIITNIYSRFSVPIIRNLSDEGVLVGVVLYNNIKTDRFSKSLRELGIKTVLSLAAKFVQNVSRSLVLKYLRKGKKTVPATAKELVDLEKITHVTLRNLDHTSSLRQIAQFNPDILILASLSQIVKSNLINLPSRGTLNIHPSLLPRHRGPRPVFWTMLFGESDFGFTVHEVTEKIDTGSILFQKNVAIQQIKNESDINHHIFCAVADVLLEYIEKYFEGNCSPKMVSSKESYEGFPKMKDLKEFAEKGFST